MSALRAAERAVGTAVGYALAAVAWPVSLALYVPTVAVLFVLAPSVRATLAGVDATTAAVAATRGYRVVDATGGPA